MPARMKRASWVQPALSFLTSIADPLYPSSAHAIGVRIAFTGVWDRTLKRIEPQNAE